ncbi:hypothetical protein GQ43DRAFT_387504 [Delitschia confertaspora ATCC 74209]|uniref:Fanconi-associated nuclease n=1 Tax=Delitschia confertaspora ATCC 74209 TaxID=1513339 RepID=A0A9P4JSZ0_9PLEO|nr:hypothetical protein GQ43DRAFT_387504 [Delitschia confertaspora ATCC 74209]
MVLNVQSPSRHNQMITKWLKKNKSTQLDDDNTGPAKRQRIGNKAFEPEPESVPRSPRFKSPVITNFDAEQDDEIREPALVQKTDIESALPAIEANAEALEEYETFKASQNDNETTVKSRLNDRKWVRGKSSIYVDAFNLALDTVLDEESHLFNEAEKEVFKQWRDLNYEAQYLYVRLFLRKKAAWHRIKNLAYHSDIADMESALEALQQTRDLPGSSTVVEAFSGELGLPPETTLGSSFTFADGSDEITTLEEASTLLKLDELKTLAKDAKVQGKNKPELLKALRSTSQKQAGLAFVGLKRSDTEASRQSSASSRDPETPEKLPVEDTISDSNRNAHFTRKIINETGPCIRLTLSPLKLFERVHLVFYRSTEWTEKSLTTIILAKIARRNFPEYIVSRSTNIFSSRSSLLEFETSLRIQHRIDNILEFNRKPDEQRLQVILDIFEDVYPRWKMLLREEQRKEESIYSSGEGAYLRRLSPAWVYTRIIHKATAVLAKQKQHKREHELLTGLLQQRLFHHARRGVWYQRKALLEEHYMADLTPIEGRSAEAQKKHWKRIALQTCEDGLQDNLVHIIHHYDLQKRVKKLEKSLKTAKRAQHDFSHVRLAAPVEVIVEGVQILPEQYLNRNTKRGAKTVWLDPFANNVQCSVEEMCLSHYRSYGWKGYHSEGGIVRTLFAYLFYDILFTYVPNVFQTPFQTCPLDLHTDAFYPSRISEINRRLIEIGNGGAETLIRKVWEDHNERKTCVIGLDWTFALEDLLGIARCFDGEALATICKVMAQEYGQRGGGVPDLFLWHSERGEVLFVEVKSENDRLSDAQRLWIHILSGAGVKVELCAARAEKVRIE